MSNWTPANPLSIFARVLYALILREALTRFGRNRLGYLWAFLEPSAYVAIFVFGRAAIADQIPFGESLILFILTGLMAFRIPMSIINRVRGAIGSNLALLTYPVVKPFDLMVARMILESITMVTVFLIFLAGVTLFSGIHALIDLKEMSLAIAAGLYLGLGMGIFLAVFTRIFPVLERIWGLISLPLFFSSGMFFLPASLPPEFQALVSWNPLLHCVEWMRTASYIDYLPVLDRGYLLGFSTIALLLGLLANHFLRQEILES